MIEKLPKLKKFFLNQKILIGISFLVGLVLGYILGIFRIHTFLSFPKISINFSWLIDFINHPFFQTHSSYTLGVAISAVAIIVAFIQFMSGKNEFRFQLRVRLRKVALFLALASLILVFLGEIEIAGRPFLFEIIGAILMVSSIAFYLYIITTPLRKISPKGIKMLRRLLIGAVANSRVNKLSVANEIETIFDSLLDISLSNKEAQRIFIEDFGSDDLLKHFSESGYIFDTTINFLRDTIEQNNHTSAEHIELFTTRLMIRSIENERSFLNMFIAEKIYPDMRFPLDEIMLKCNNTKVISAILGETMWNSFRQLSKKGQLRYISLASRYFRTVYRENNHHSLGADGYAKNYEINIPLVRSFYSQTKHFFDSSRTDDFQHKMELIDSIHWIGHSYLFGVRTSDKPDELKKATGKFIYEILESFIAWNKIGEEYDHSVYFNFHQLHNEFLEVSDGRENNIAYNEFIIRLKNKVIGTPVDDRDDRSWGVNYKGYFPEMILVYFHMFGFYLFSESRNEQQDTDLHLPIIMKLSEAFPRLYDGFKQEFYDAENLPQEKEEKLKEQGRKIIDQFLTKNMVYNREENSLSYYYSGNIHNSKIFLNDVKTNQKIEPKKL